MGQKSEIIYARISEELKGRLNAEVNKRGEAEAVIIREALREYFAWRDNPQSTQRYPEPPDKLNDAPSGNPVTPQDIAAAKLAHRAVSEVQGAPPPASDPSAEAEVARMHRKVSGIIRRGSAAAGRSSRREKRGK